MHFDWQFCDHRRRDNTFPFDSFTLSRRALKCEPQPVDSKPEQPLSAASGRIESTVSNGSQTACPIGHYPG